MDIVSHGLWGGLAFGRANKKRFWLAFLFGMAPDLFAFGLLSARVIFGLAPRPQFTLGHPDPSFIPPYVFQLYNMSHSLVIFAAVFLLIWVIRKRPLWEMSAWGLHILFDIFTHSEQFFPTPFLWPVSDVRFAGISWMHPLIFIPNVLALTVFYGYWLILGKRRAAEIDSEPAIESDTEPEPVYEYERYR
ncbi:hypothetical protein HY573_02545 [Candidatus Parcubacteria bacterium]|nr:hypothetical protein [Candidatus Parcubacteria bacterium]